MVCAMQEVKQAWRKAVRESHPDLHTNSPDHIQRQASERFKVALLKILL